MLADQIGKSPSGAGPWGEFLKAFVAARPADKVAWSLLGLWHQKKGDLGEAAGCYEKAVAIDPQFVPALNNLGGIYFEKGDLDRAARACERAIAIDPNYAKAHVNLGHIYQKKGDRLKALQHWRSVLAIESENTEARDLIAELLSRRPITAPPSPPGGGR